MPKLEELYTYYCRRWECKPNSHFSETLRRADKVGKDLEVVDISENYVGKKGIIPVLDFVKNIKTVKFLNTSNSLMEHEELHHLVYCLALHPCISSVILRNNNLHDGSINHIMELLTHNWSITEFDVSDNAFSETSMGRIAKQLNLNKEKKLREKEEAALLSLQRHQKRPSYRCTVNGTLNSSNSGGCTHFSTWWQNPQYFLKVSRDSRIKITMEFSHIHDTCQAGFVVFQSNGMRKILTCDERSVVAESPITGDTCSVEVVSHGSKVLAVMPFTFSPQRNLTYTITSELLPEERYTTEGWISLEPIAPEYDWAIESFEGSWGGTSAGGNSKTLTWRQNPMIRIRTAAVNTAFHAGTDVIVRILLTKESDSDRNDHREIGFDVVKPDLLTEDGKPPMVFSDAHVVTTVPHVRETSVVTELALKLEDLDFYIVPSLLNPGEAGTYVLTVFCTAAFESHPSTFPHSWFHKVIDGVWDTDSCGGSREDYQSWKNNQSFEIVCAPSPICVFCLEIDEPLSGAIAIPGDRSLVADRDYADFARTHLYGPLQARLSLINALTPDFSILEETAFSTRCESMRVENSNGAYLLAPMTKHAGQTGKYRIQLFSCSSIVLQSIVTLIERQRAFERNEIEDEVSRRNKSITAGLSHFMDEASVGVELATVRDAIILQCGDHNLFVDRDFPAAPSSLWLDPEMKQPLDFPKIYTWKRPGEIAENPVFFVPEIMAMPFPFGKNEWFTSVMYAVASKPKWLSRVTVAYDPCKGFAQFRFFEGGTWVGVTVDDLLLVDSVGDLIYGHTQPPSSQFYFPLLEKAYAKFHRCYEALEPKVCPGSSFIDLVCQGLSDVSGGLNTVIPIERDGKRIFPDEEKEYIWSRLKMCLKDSIYMAFVLRKESTGAANGFHVGILADHLYSVVDACLADGTRYIKLKNWGPSTDTTWRGKFCARSDQWTCALRALLRFNNEEDIMWLTYEDALFYFTDLIITEEYANSAWTPCSMFHSQETDPIVPFSLSPQFSLRVTPLKYLKKDTAEIVIGLHQEDPRLTITRAKDATAMYKHAIGLAVFSVDNYGRQLQVFKNENVISGIQLDRKREMFCTISIDQSVKDIVVVPFRENSLTKTVPCKISAWSSDSIVAWRRIEDDIIVDVEGEWNGVSAGGPPTAESWRNNSQYFLYPTETSEMTISLTSRFYAQNDVAIPEEIGFTLHKAKNCFSMLSYDPESVIFEAKSDQGKAQGTLTLYGMKERRGLPYILVPYCGKPEVEGKYLISIHCDKKVTINPVEPRLDWHKKIIPVSIRASLSNAGGSPRFPSWRYSPQYVLNFPIELEGKLFISAVSKKKHDKVTEFGLMLLKADQKYEKGNRRKLVYAPGEVLAVSPEKNDVTHISTDLSLERSADKLILVVFTTIPYQEMEIEVSIYSAPTIEVAPVTEWAHVALLEDNWKLGISSGGNREKYSSWINNPFLGLTVVKPTNLTIILLQYPHGPEKPIHRRFGVQRAFLPPPITNVANIVEIGLDVVLYDGELTPVTKSGPSKKSELSLVTHLKPSGERPYLLVPHTYLPEQNEDFKLIVFADNPIELSKVENPRLYYV